MNRIHLEEDVAKSTHLANASTIDYNRAGTPLMEIVTEPDIDCAEEAYAYIKSLQQILQYAKISDADMDKGQMRCDVNISVRKKGTTELGTKLEIKNLNSTSSVRSAIYYEIDRQIEELDMGIAQVQATLAWDPNTGQTSVMRIKEDSHDYRYFPEPDLLPVHTAELVEKMRPQVPELPHEKRARFENDFGVSSYDAGVLTSDLVLADYFEEAASGSKFGKKIANWIINTVLGKLNESFLSIDQNPIHAESLSELVELIEAGTISNNQAKDVFAALWESPEKKPADIAKSMGFEPADNSAIESIIDEILEANPAKVEEVKGGNAKAANWFTGQVMKASKGKANPKMVSEYVQKKLEL